MRNGILQPGRRMKIYIATTWIKNIKFRRPGLKGQEITTWLEKSLEVLVLILYPAPK